MQTKDHRTRVATPYAEGWNGQVATMPLFCALRCPVNGNYLGRKWFLSSLVLALFVVCTSVNAAKQGRTGIQSTASIGIWFEVRPYIHARQMSLSTHGSEPLPSSSGRHLCLNMKNVAGFALNTAAPGEPELRLAPVVYERIASADATGCTGVTLSIPTLPLSSTPTVVMITVL